MKKLSQLLIIALCLTFVNAQELSEIKNVTVYLDGAEINRIANIDIKSGTTEFIFNGLSPHIEETVSYTHLTLPTKRIV